MTKSPSDTKIIFELKQGTMDAKGILCSDGFVMLKGSKIKLQIALSCPKPAKAQRKKHAGKFDSTGVLLEDVLLKSPNVAAGFGTGNSVNARETGKTTDGKTLNTLEKGE